MDLERVLPVFEVVDLLDHFGGQLSRLAHRDEAGADALRHRGAEDEAAAFDADHHIDVRDRVRRGERVDGGLQAVGVFEQRRDVEEVDAGLRKVGHLANHLLEIDGQHEFLIGCESSSRSRSDLRRS